MNPVEKAVLVMAVLWAAIIAWTAVLVIVADRAKVSTGKD